MKTVLYIVNSYFPQGSPGSSRAVSFCRILNLLGYKVHVISSNTLSDCDEKIDCFYTRDYINIGNTPKKYIFLGNKPIVRAIKEYLKRNKVSFVFLNADAYVFCGIYKYCKKNSIPIVLEHCEWYDRTNFTFGIFDLRYIRMNYAIKQKYSFSNGVVSISSFLNDYYVSKKTPAIRIPTILDIRNNDFDKKRKPMEKKILVYAGSPGKSKELLFPIIDAFFDNEIKNKFELHIYGCSKKQVLMNVGFNNKQFSLFDTCIFVHGRIPQNQVYQVYKNADFSIFIRPNRRSSKSGFPTKLGESMCCGTPVISNLTGDIGYYLKNGFNGYVIDNYSSVKECLFECEKLNELEYQQLCKNAFDTANNYFNLNNYILQFEEFIKKITNV